MLLQVSNASGIFCVVAWRHALLVCCFSAASSLRPKASEAVKLLTNTAKQTLASKAAKAYRHVASVATGLPQPQLVSGIASASPKILTAPVVEHLSAALRSSNGMPMNPDKDTGSDGTAENSASGLGIMQAVKAMGLTGRT